jgi:anti-anti-sigma factor
VSESRQRSEPLGERGGPRPAGSPLEVAADDEGRVASVLCRGELDARTADRLRGVIDAALKRPRVLLCLDLEEVTHVDSYGIGVVVATIERCASQHVHLELWPGAAVEQMLHVMDVPVPLRAYPARPSQLFPESEWA